MARITKKNSENKEQNIRIKQETVKKNKALIENKSFAPSLSIETYIGNKGLFITIGIIFLISLVVFKDFYFGRLVYLFKDIGSDSINVDYPAAALISKMNQQQYYFTWTFYSGMGYPMNSGLFNPLHPVNLVYSIFRPIIELIYGSNPAFLKFPVFMMILLLTGITAYFYFRTLNFSSYISITGSLLVSFMGYNIASSAWNHYYDVFQGIFLLFAFEQFYKKGRWYFLPIAVMMISYNFFNLYIYGLFLISYFIFRYLAENPFDFKKFFILSIKILGLSIFGLLIGITNFLPGLISQLNSPRVSGNIDAIKDISAQNPLLSDRFYEFTTTVLRSFSSDMLGTGTDFRGWYNYLEAPLFYCGIVVLLLIPQVFNFLSKKEKIAYSTFGAIWLVVALFPSIRNAFHLNIGNYYKIGLNFFIPIVFLFFGIKSLALVIDKKQINLPVLGITSGLLLIALFYPYKMGNVELTDTSIRNYSAILLIFYSGLIYLLSNEKTQGKAKTILILIIFIELTSFSSISVSNRLNYSSVEFKLTEGGYKDNSVPAIEYIKQNDGGFYRMEKDYSSGNSMHGSLNDSQVQGYFGTSLYSSFNQPSYINFLRETGVIEDKSETGTRWAPGLRNRPLLLTLASVKYFLSKDEKPFLLNSGYVELKSFNDVKVLKNSYYLPFGYAYSDYMTLSDFKKCSNLQKDISLLRAFVIDERSAEFAEIEGKFNRLKLSDTLPEFNFDKYSEIFSKRKKDTLSIQEFRQNYIKGTISADSAKMFFASIPFDMNWEARINGNEIKPILINTGFIGLELEAGTNTIELKYFPAYLTYSIAISIVFSLIFILIFIIRKDFSLKVKIITGSVILISILFHLIYI